MNRIALLATLTAALVACDRTPDASAPTESGLEPANIEAAAAPIDDVPAVPCALSVGEFGISGAQLRSADGACRVYLPSAVQVGELPVRVSAAGDDSVSAVEAQTPDGPLYATEGTVTITAVDGNRITGRVDAHDSVEPVKGTVATTFDLVIGDP